MGSLIDETGAKLSPDDDNIAIVINPTDHPVGTRMLVDRVALLGSNAPAHDITILEWSDTFGGTAFRSQVNLDNNTVGTVAWHVPGDYHFWHLLDENGKKIEPFDMSEAAEMFERDSVGFASVNRADPVSCPIGTRLLIQSSAPLAEIEEVIVVRWGEDTVNEVTPNQPNRRADDEVRLWSLTTNKDQWTKVDLFEIKENRSPIYVNPINHPSGTTLLVSIPFTRGGIHATANVVVGEYVDGQVILSGTNRGPVPRELEKFLNQGRLFERRQVKVLKVVKRAPKSVSTKLAPVSPTKTPTVSLEAGLEMRDDFFYHFAEMQRIAKKAGNTVQVTIT